MELVVGAISMLAAIYHYYPLLVTIMVSKMRLEDHVINLELAKQLKEFGVKQESLFYHYNDPYNDGQEDWVITCWEDYNIEYRDTNAYPAYSAFTATELGELLPNTVTVKENEPFNNFRIKITKFFTFNDVEGKVSNYSINYDCDTTAMEGEHAWNQWQLTKNIYEPNLANAMARMLIYLKENNLIEEKE